MKEACHTFIAQLHAMLEAEDREVVGWTDNERGFKIRDVDRFRDTVLPRYYRHTKLASFQRQLNLYGFKKLSHGPDMGAYFHPLFTRGSSDALREVKRSAIRRSAVGDRSRGQAITIEPVDSSSRPRRGSVSSVPPSVAVAYNMSPRRSADECSYSSEEVSLISRSNSDDGSDSDLSPISVRRDITWPSVGGDDHMLFDHLISFHSDGHADDGLVNDFETIFASSGMLHSDEMSVFFSEEEIMSLLS